MELINTGTELMLGRVLNTHEQWLGRELADHGYVVSRQVAVPDTGPEIQGAVREALGRADLLVVTGGLGPTSDDLTRDLIAQLLGKRLAEDATVLARLQAFFDTRRRKMPASTRVQALVPEGALVLQNENGTAPGLAMEVRPNPYRSGGARSWLIMLPGPPRELRPMFHNTVLPLIEREFPPSGYVCRTLRGTGLGESVVEERIAGDLAPLCQAGLELGYCSRPGEVDVRLAAQGPGAAALVERAERAVREKLGSALFANAGEELEQVVVRLLTGRKQTLALAESCTGGLIAHRITNVPGASAVLLAGLVTYSNAAKVKCLGVRTTSLEAHGAVSESVAREMAEGARAVTGADYAISVTGIAGPSGGSPQKPVGTVFMALAGPFETVVERHLNPVDRETFKQMASQEALDLLRRKLTGSETA